MRKLWMAAVAGGALLAVSPAWAQGSSDTYGGSSGSSTGSSSGSMGGGTSGSMGSTGSMQGSHGSQMSGSMADTSQMAKVQNVDKDKNMVTLKLPLAPSAQIMKDGQTVSLDQIKEGDQVRASFDPTTSAITRLDVQSKSGQTGKSGKGSSSDQMNR